MACLNDHISSQKSRHVTDNFFERPRKSGVEVLNCKMFLFDRHNKISESVKFRCAVSFPSGYCKMRLLPWFGNSKLPAQFLFGDVIIIPGIIWNSCSEK